MAAKQELHLGYTANELAVSPYAKFLKPLAALPAHVQEALLVGAVSPELLLPFENAPQLLNAGYWPVESGYALCPDGSARIFVLTKMPRVTPQMWDWWFGWHGSEAQRYKLWHPRAHVHAEWADGRSDLNSYIGRTSRVVEYIGSALLKLDIQFVPPESIGFDGALLQDNRREVVICARGALSAAPMNTGWLIHHVRALRGGSEMRSRFWIGGNHIRPRGMNGIAGRAIGKAASLFSRPTATQAAELLVHCAQEMNHLAAILPALHGAFGPNAKARTRRPAEKS